MFGLSGNGFNQLARMPAFIGLSVVLSGMAVIVAFGVFAVRDIEQASERRQMAYDGGLSTWLQECRADGRKIDDCTGAWQKDAVLRRLYVKQ